MAGKAVAVAKAAKKPTVAKAVKKPVVAKAAKKPVAKATVKVVAKAVKKPVATKATAKKPVVAKFNLNKLMMLIVRDAPKKGKKMMGGYKKADLQATIFTPIITFITNNKQRINSRITDILSNEDLLKTTVGLPVADGIPAIFNETLNEADTIQFINNIAEQEYLQKTLDNFTLPNTVSITDLSNYDKRTYDTNFMTIVIALCKVYKRFDDNAQP